MVFNHENTLFSRIQSLIPQYNKNSETSNAFKTRIKSWVPNMVIIQTKYNLHCTCRVDMIEAFIISVTFTCFFVCFFCCFFVVVVVVLFFFSFITRIIFHILGSICNLCNSYSCYMLAIYNVQFTFTSVLVALALWPPTFALVLSSILFFISFSFNNLHLPKYSSIDELRSKLLLAINDFSEEFGLSQSLMDINNYFGFFQMSSSSFKKIDRCK